MMQNPKRNAEWADDQAEQDVIVPWTAEQARQWRATHPAMSLWWPVQVQVLVGVVIVLAGLAAGWSKPVVWSMLYGVAASVIPAAVHVFGFRRMTRKQSSMPVQLAAGVGFAALLLWEGVKIILAIALLWMAPRMVAHLNWLAMLIAFVLVVKAHWLALMLKRRQ